MAEPDEWKMSAVELKIWQQIKAMKPREAHMARDENFRELIHEYHLENSERARKGGES